MALSLKGIHVPHRKNTANTVAERMPAPKTVTIPMSMHIGAPAVPSVKVGDTVKVGTKIADSAGKISAPVFSGISGTVTKIADIRYYYGNVPSVTIESDGEMAIDESIAPPTVSSDDDLVKAIHDSGVVGLGGAGFPTHFKVDVDSAKIDHVIINCAECEPYITSDTNTMITRSDDMAYAIEAIKKYFGITSVIIGIEKNKPKAVVSMKALAAATTDDKCNVSVKVLPSIYPQGGEKVLIYHTTGRAVPMGKLPIDVGCVVLNCTTLASIGTYLKTGMPLTEKCVTVDGGAVKNPKNVIVPIGTAIADVFEFCGGLTCDPEKVIYGGPMMGVTVPDTTAPVLKTTNAILALTPKEAKLPRTTACIRCGACTNNCPFGLAPAAIMKAFDKRDTDKIESLSVNACMECGCCSFVCPANRPLAQTNKLAKALLKEAKAKEASKA